MTWTFATQTLAGMKQTALISLEITSAPVQKAIKERTAPMQRLCVKVHSVRVKLFEMSKNHYCQYCVIKLVHTRNTIRFNA